MPCSSNLDQLEDWAKNVKELNMPTKTVSASAQSKTTPHITTLPVELRDAVNEVNQRVRDCEKLDTAIDACPADRARLDDEYVDLTEKLASTEANLALCDRGSDAAIKHLASADKLTLSVASVERERKRIDGRELALEAHGAPLDEKLAQAVIALRLETGRFSATMREAIAEEYRAAIPAVLVARARHQALATLGDPSVQDSVWDSRLIDPECGYQHLLRDGPRHQLSDDEDMLTTPHPDATIAGEALATMLIPVRQALAAGRRLPFRSLRERRQSRTYDGTRGYTISTGRPVAVTN
jgi:hypothetical protein